MSKVYITPEGARQLREELDHLWKVKRPEVTKRVAAAAALGDRSENADYTYGKRQLREIDSRVRYLGKRLDNLEIVDRKPPQRDTIYFGAYVTLVDEEDEENTYRLVGVDEIDLERGFISIESPVAKSLLGKKVGDEIRLTRPKGEAWAEIIAVRY